MTKVLVTGGVRCGKSRYAESLLADAEALTYLAAGYPAEPAADAEWASRVRTHQQRRPSHWTTVETVDLASEIRAAQSPVLIDCLGTWLSRRIDAWAVWERPLDQWSDLFDESLDDLLDAWRSSPQRLVAVTNEVGWGLVSEYRSGRLFADLLGRVNQRLGAVSDDIVLMVCGRPLHLGFVPATAERAAATGRAQS